MDKLTVKSGSTGELRTITDKERINQWIGFIKEIHFTPDSNQEDRTGWRYWVKLYEGDHQVFELFPNHINKVYYLVDEKVLSSMEDLFNTGKKEW